MLKLAAKYFMYLVVSALINTHIFARQKEENIDCQFDVHVHFAKHIFTPLQVFMPLYICWTQIAVFIMLVVFL